MLVATCHGGNKGHDLLLLCNPAPSEAFDWQIVDAQTGEVVLFGLTRTEVRTILKKWGSDERVVNGVDFDKIEDMSCVLYNLNHTSKGHALSRDTENAVSGKPTAP
jgi:hypothetical protein